MIMLKDGKSFYMLMTENFDEIISTKLPRSVKKYHSICGMVNFLSFFVKDNTNYNTKKTNNVYLI